MDEPFDLTEILSYLWKKKLIIIIVTLIFAIVPAIKDGFSKPQQVVVPEETVQAEEVPYFYAQTTFTIGNLQVLDEKTRKTTSDLTDAIIETYGEVVKSQAALNNVVTNLNLPISSTELANLISVSRVSKSNLVRIVVAYTDESQALNIANALMQEFVNNIPNVYSDVPVSVVDKAYTLSKADIADIFKTYIFQSVGLVNTETLLTNILFNVDIAKILPDEYLKSIFNEYIYTDSEIAALGCTDILQGLFPPPAPAIIVQNSVNMRKVCIAGAIGFILSAGCLVVIDFLSNTINNENYIDTKILATVTNTDNKDIYDIARVKLEKYKTILIANSESNGKSNLVINNLATSFANSGKKVLLVDLGNNSSSLLNQYNGQGLFDCIDDFENIANCISKSSVANLDILLKGSTNSYCVNENILESIVNKLNSNYDYVIINSRNMLEDANSLILTKIVKDSVLVITQRKTKTETYCKLKESISDVNGNLLGSILIK